MVPQEITVSKGCERLAPGKRKRFDDRVDRWLKEEGDRDPFPQTAKHAVSCRANLSAGPLLQQLTEIDRQPVRGRQGELCCLKPFPSMPVMFWNDPGDAKYKAAYFEHFDGIWRHGDWATLTERGGVIIHGRSDATLNPGGVRIGTAEIYRQVESFDDIEEALVVGQSWDNDVRVILFVRMAAGATLTDELIASIKSRIRSGATPRHVPRHVIAVPDIPRTRSGKITELAVRDVIHGRPVKNTEALANAEALAHFADLPQLAE